MDLITALKKFHADDVLVDSKGRAWTAEDLEYTLRDDVKDPKWNRQQVSILPDGIYRTDKEGKPEELLYLLSSEVSSRS